MNKKIFASLCLLSMTWFTPCHAASPSRQKLDRALVEDTFNPKWLTQAWDTKANAPYVAKALDVEKSLQKKTPSAVLLKRYEVGARKKPDTALAIFPWVYARYRLVETGQVKKPLSQVCEELYKVLVMAPPPPSAEYARLRFKIEARTHLNSRVLKIGEKLVALYPTDQNLLSAYNGVLSASGNIEQAVHNGYLLVKQSPKNPNYRWNLGMDLSTLAWRRRDSKLLNASESQFNAFEKLAPPNHPLRASLPNMREYIRIKRLRFAGKTP